MKIFKSPVTKAAVLFVLGCLAAGATVLEMQKIQQEEKVARFHSLVDHAATQLQSRIGSYEHGLRGTRGVIISVGLKNITRTKFREYMASRDLPREFPGSRGFGFIRRVRPEDRNVFLRAARLDGKPDFQIRQLAQHDGDLYVVQYIEPETLNNQVVGLDIVSESLRLEAAMMAIRSGMATLTRPLTLVQAKDEFKSGFLFLLPVYSSGATPAKEDERQKAAIGLVDTPLVIDEVMADFDFRDGEFAMSLYDAGNRSNPQLFYASSDPDKVETEELVQKVPLSLYGQTWLLEIKALPPFIRSLNFVNPLQVAAYILSFSAMLSLFFYVYLVYRKQQELTESEILKNAILESSLDAIVTINHEGLITEFNENAEVMFGHKKIDVLRKPMADLIIPEQYREAHHKGMENYLRYGTHNILRQRVEITALRASGEEFPVELIVSPLHLNEGLFFTAFVNDITERQKTKETLENARLEAERASSAKTLFLATMSHEIRTPLNAMIGVNDLLSSTPLDSEQSDLIKIARQAGISLLNIVTNILDFSKIESGKMELDLQETDLCAVIDSVLSIMGPKALEKDLELIAVVDYPIMEKPLVDPLRIKQVLINLTANAIKFTERGSIEIRLSTKRNPLGENVILFTVSDTGIGISEPSQQLIFEDFIQADLSTTRKYGGTGLGLAISKKLVSLFGGELGVDSREGQGSRFWFTVPTIHQCLWTPDRHKEFDCFVLDCGLKSTHALYNHLQAISAHTALIKSFDEIAGHDRLSALFLDERQLPFFTTAQIEKLKSLDAVNVIKVLLKDAGQQKITEKWEKMFDQQFVKPVQINELNLFILDCIKSYQQGQKFFHSSVNKAEPVQHMDNHFLLVEDSAANQLVIKTMLAKAGYSVDIAVNGAEGVEKASRTPYDIILMDLSMPVMGGLEAAERIRNEEGPNRNTPIIALTASAFDENRKQCLEAGMNGFLTKPLNMISLKEEIERHLRIHADRGKNVMAASQRPDPNADRIIDSEILERLKNETSQAIFPDLLKVFLEQGAKRIERIEQAISANDFSTLKNEIHSLKSESATFGAIKLAELVTHIDLLCKQNENEKAFIETKEIQEQWSLVDSALQKMNY